MQTKSSLVSTQRYLHDINKSETETIQLAFKSVSMSQLLAMRALATRLVDAVSDLFAKSTEIPKQRTEVESDAITGREVRRIEEKDGISQEVLTAANERKKKALNALLDVFLDPKYHASVCALIANSLREEGYEAKDVQEADLQVFSQLVVGFLSANVSVIAPLMSQLGNLTGVPSAPAEPATAAQ